MQAAQIALKSPQQKRNPAQTCILQREIHCSECKAVYECIIYSIFKTKPYLKPYVSGVSNYTRSVKGHNCVFKMKQSSRFREQSLHLLCFSLDKFSFVKEQDLSTTRVTGDKSIRMTPNVNRASTNKALPKGDYVALQQSC